MFAIYIGTTSINCGSVLKAERFNMIKGNMMQWLVVTTLVVIVTFGF